MNRTISNRVEKIEGALKPRYPEIPTYTPEERVFLKEIARRVSKRVLAEGREAREYEEEQAVLNEIVEEMRAEEYFNPFSEEDSL